MAALPAVPAISDIPILFNNVISIALQFFGVIFFILILASAFKFLTAGDDSNSVQGAKKTLTYALGGLIFILVSYMIIRLVAWVTGADEIHLFRTYL